MVIRKAEDKSNMDMFHLSEFVRGVEEACEEKIFNKERQLIEEGKYDSKEFQKYKEQIQEDNSLKELSVISENISLIEMLEQQKIDVKELKSILKPVKNRVISKTIEKELKKIYTEEEKRIKDNEKITEGIKKGQFTKYAIFENANQYIIEESDNAIKVPKETLGKLCENVIRNIKNKNLKQKSIESFENEQDDNTRYVEKELEELSIIKEFLNMEIPIEISEKMRMEEPNKMQKYLRIRSERKHELKAIENLYMQSGENKCRIDEIKKIAKQLECMEGKISEKSIEKIKKHLDKQVEKEHKKEERLQQKINRKKNSKGISKSISSLDRYKKIIEMSKVASKPVMNIESIKKEQDIRYKVANTKLDETISKGEYNPEEPIFYGKDGGDVYSIKDSNGNEMVSGGYYSNQQDINKRRAEIQKIEEDTKRLIDEAEKRNNEHLTANVTIEEMWKQEIDFEISNEKDQKFLPVNNIKVDKHKEFAKMLGNDGDYSKSNLPKINTEEQIVGEETKEDDRYI